LAEHKPFQQRIAGKAVGPVNSVTGHLTRGIKTRDSSDTVEVCLYASHDKMRAGSDRYGLPGKIEVELLTGAIALRKTLSNK